MCPYRDCTSLNKLAHGIITLFVSSFAYSQGQIQTWLRLKSPIMQMSLSHSERFLAFTEKETLKLFVLDLLSKEIVPVSKNALYDSNFIWLPYGTHILYRETTKNKDQINSRIFIYDCVRKHSGKVAEYPYATSSVIFSPTSHTLYATYKNEFIVKKFHYPDARKKAVQTLLGDWVYRQGTLLYLARNGAVPEEVYQGERILNSDTSLKGELLFADEKHKLFRASQKREVQFVDDGARPKWHLSGLKFIYAGARILGDRVIGFDIKISSDTQEKTWLTHASFRTPPQAIWFDQGKKILFSPQETTDLLILDDFHDSI